VSGAAPTRIPLLEDIQRAPSSAQISDSSRTMLEQMQLTTPADFAVINIGGGDEWLTSRLYIAAAMLERMRGVKVLVFVEQAPTSDRRFVAVVPIGTVRWVLARRFPWLEAGFASAYAEHQPTGMRGQLPTPLSVAASPTFITSDTGAVDPFLARQIVGAFIEALQSARGATAESVTLGTGIHERAQWVTRDLLRETCPSRHSGSGPRKRSTRLECVARKRCSGDRGRSSPLSMSTAASRASCTAAHCSRPSWSGWPTTAGRHANDFDPWFGIHGARLGWPMTSRL